MGKQKGHWGKNPAFWNDCFGCLCGRYVLRVAHEREMFRIRSKKEETRVKMPLKIQYVVFTKGGDERSLTLMRYQELKIR